MTIGIDFLTLDIAKDKKSKKCRLPMNKFYY
jgi:hypothetical protein